MPYIVAWTIVEEQKKPKKNALFILPPIMHDLFEITKRKRDAVGRYKALLETDAIAVVWGEIKEMKIQYTNKK